MNSSILVYGANGFTAGLVLERLVASGVRPILSARNPAALRALGERLNLSTRPANLEDPSSLRHALEGVRVMLNLAGPFADTAEPAVRACLDSNVHYLDVSGEVDSLAHVSRLHDEARSRGVMLMPAVGFDVVPSDCLCAHVAGRSADVRAVYVAISGLELVSKGSLKALMRDLGKPTRVQRGGELREVPPGELTRRFDFGRGPTACVAVTWGDLVTAPITTGAAEVETYFEFTPGVAAAVHANRYLQSLYRLPWFRAYSERLLPSFVGEPSRAERARRSATIVVEAWDRAGRRTASRLVTPESYTLTADTASVIARRVAQGDYESGFQTPGRLFGADFILDFPDVTRIDFEAST